MWYNKYTGFPYKHLGNDLKTGIDCFNLIRLIYKNERGIEIPYSTSDWCKIVDEDWYATPKFKIIPINIISIIDEKDEIFSIIITELISLKFIFNFSELKNL